MARPAGLRKDAGDRRIVIAEGKLTMFPTSQGMVSIVGELDSTGQGPIIKFVHQNT